VFTDELCEPTRFCEDVFRSMIDIGNFMKEMEQVVCIRERERERIISDLEDCIDCVHSHGTFDSLGNFLRSTRFSFLLSDSVVVFEKYSISPLTYTLSGQRIGGDLQIYFR